MRPTETRAIRSAPIQELSPGLVLRGCHKRLIRTRHGRLPATGSVSARCFTWNGEPAPRNTRTASRQAGRQLPTTLHVCVGAFSWPCGVRVRACIRRDRVDAHSTGHLHCSRHHRPRPPCTRRAPLLGHRGASRALPPGPRRTPRVLPPASLPQYGDGPSTAWPQEQRRQIVGFHELASIPSPGAERPRRTSRSDQ